MKARWGITVALVMLVTAACAGGVGPATTAPTVDITGKWVGSWVAINQALGNGVIEMTVTQNGSKFSGNLLVTGTRTDPTGPIQGTISGNQVQIIQPSELIGNLTVQGDTMKGIVHGVVDANATLTRQK